MGFFSKKESTFDPRSAFTADQLKNLDALQGLANTGTGGGLILGEGFTGSLGEFEQNAGEKSALESLRGITGGNNKDLNTSRDVFNSFANTTFNPDDPSSGFSVFSRALAKAGREAQDQLNQQAAISGGVFGSGRGRDTASLQADMANQRGSFLAQLFNQSENRKLQGAQGLQGIANQELAFNQQLQQQEAVERQLKDQKAKAELNEFKRSRGEELSRIGLMQKSIQNPLAPITTSSPSLFSQLAPSLIGAVGSFASGGLSSMFGGGGGGTGASSLLGGQSSAFSGNSVSSFKPSGSFSNLDFSKQLF